jgi:uncharacterized protein (TIGR01777 family)
MKNKKIVIAGGSGFIGNSLAAYFGEDNDIIVLTRRDRPAQGRVTYIRWDGKTLQGWEQYLENTDLLINLTGKSVNCRYNKKNKREIFDSRTQATQVLGAAIQTCTHPPKVWINAASATIYRHATDRPMDEHTGEIGSGFSVEVCQLWEKTFNEIQAPATRKIILRIAVTLGWQKGGVMQPYLNLVKFGLGGHQGNGQQMYSWVHITDVCRMMAWLYEQPQQEGTFNCSAPNPVPNHTFMQTLRNAGGCKLGLPAPTPLLALGAAMIGTETELLLKSRWVLPTRITEAGFVFQYTQLADAFKNILTHFPRSQYHLW